MACVALTACKPADEDPRLVDAELVNPTTIRLAFSEAVSLGSVEPSSFRLSIAISDTRSTVYYPIDFDYYDYYNYDYDPGGLSDGDPTAAPDTYDPPDDPPDPGEPPDTGGGYDTTSGGGYGATSGGYYGTTGDYYIEPHPTPELALPIPTAELGDLSVISLRGIDDWHKDLELRDPVTDRFACRTVEELQYLGYEAGLFVHYRPRGGEITDNDGNAIPPIGAHWLDTHPGRHTELQGVFPLLRPRIAVRCQ
jgi:hypothetical protein